MEVQGVLLMHPVRTLWTRITKTSVWWRLSMESVITYMLIIVAYAPLHPSR